MQSVDGKGYTKRCRDVTLGFKHVFWVTGGASSVLKDTSFTNKCYNTKFQNIQHIAHSHHLSSNSFSLTD